MNKVRETLAQNLRFLMEDRGYTQLKLSALAKAHGGLSQKSISKMLNKECSPKLETMLRLVNTLGISIDALITERQEAK